MIAYVVLGGTAVIGALLATGIGLQDAWDTARDAFAREPADELAPRPARRELGPGAKTLPLRDLDEEPASPAPARAHRADPEAERRTAPVARAKPPRDTEGFELPSLGAAQGEPRQRRRLSRDRQGA